MSRAREHRNDSATVEKRIAERKVVNFVVKVVLSNHKIDGTLLNYSDTGAHIKLHEPKLALHPNVPVTILVDHENTTTAIHGKVVWSTPQGGIGVLFSQSLKNSTFFLPPMGGEQLEQTDDENTDNNSGALESIHHLYGSKDLFKDALIATKAQGIQIWDHLGNEYIDCASGTFDQPLGYGHPALVEAIQKQAEMLAYVGSPFLSEDLLELAAKLIEISPPNIKHVHLRDITGSTAVEGAIKIAQTATGKRDVITFFASHHGQTGFTTDISGNSFRRQNFPSHTPHTMNVPYAHCYRCSYNQKHPSCNVMCVDKIEEFIEYASSGSVACVVVEPILGNGGNVMPPKDYFIRLKQLCDRHGIILIFDEVQTGMGRTGYMFAAEYFGVQPHMFVLAKGLSGPAPRAAILMEDGLEKMPRYQHSFTGGSGMISVATSLATIRVLQQAGFLENVRTSGEYLGRKLKTLKQRYQFIGDVRGLGLMWGLEIINEKGEPDVKLCGKIIHNGRKSGLILKPSRYGHGSVVKIRPPLIIKKQEIDELLIRLERSLEQA